MRRFILSIALFISTPLLAHAQLLNLNTGLVVTPPFPQPGESVTVAIENLPSQLTGQAITWRVAGTVQADRANERSLTLSAPDLDEPITVTAQVGGVTLTETIVSNFLDIVVEPQTRVPNFYQGRSAPSVGSQINVTALLNSNERNPANFQYTWRLNGEAVDGGAIRGKYKTTMTLPRYEDENIITLEVADASGNPVARRSIRLPIVAPTVLFYEFDPLLGLSSRPLLNNELVLVGNSATVRAEPFHLDTRVFNNPDIVEWRVNRTTTSNSSQNPYEITLQRQFTTGPIPVALRITSTSLFLQNANGSFTIRN